MYTLSKNCETVFLCLTCHHSLKKYRNYTFLLKIVTTYWRKIFICGDFNIVTYVNKTADQHARRYRRQIVDLVLTRCDCLLLVN